MLQHFCKKNLQSTILLPKFAPEFGGNSAFFVFRRDGRVVDYTGLENRRAERHRGFESLSLRQMKANG